MSWFLFLSQPKGQEWAASGLNDLESDTRNITLSVTRSTETSNEYLIVLIDETQTTISWHVGSDFLIVLFKLNSDTLSDSGVWLLGLHSNFINNDAWCMRRACEWLLPLGSWMLFLVIIICPQLQSSVDFKLTTSLDSSRFISSHLKLRWIKN